MFSFLSDHVIRKLLTPFVNSQLYLKLLSHRYLMCFWLVHAVYYVFVYCSCLFNLRWNFLCVVVSRYYYFVVISLSFRCCSEKKRKCRRSWLIDGCVSEHLEGFWHYIANRSEFLTFFFCFSFAKLYCRHTAQCGVLSVLELSRTALSKLALVM